MSVARQRAERVADEVQQAAAEILHDLKDPRIGFVTVVRAEVSTDLRHAKLYISVFGPEADRTATMAALERAKGHVRTEIGRRVRLYHTPEVHFVADSSMAHGDRIARVLNELAAERAALPQGDGGATAPGPGVTDDTAHREER